MQTHLTIHYLLDYDVVRQFWWEEGLTRGFDSFGVNRSFLTLWWRIICYYPFIEEGEAFVPSDITCSGYLVYRVFSTINKIVLCWCQFSIILKFKQTKLLLLFEVRNCCHFSHNGAGHLVCVFRHTVILCQIIILIEPLMYGIHTCSKFRYDKLWPCYCPLY